MNSINLSGIQSLDIPPSVFDEYFNMMSKPPSAYPEGYYVEVDVVWDKHNKYQQNGSALAVMLDNCIIGYIPLLSTLKGYMQNARAENDLRRYEKEQLRYQITDFLRGNIETDLFRNHIPVKGKLSRVHIESGKVMSVSVAFDYM